MHTSSHEMQQFLTHCLPVPLAASQLELSILPHNSAWLVLDEQRDKYLEPYSNWTLSPSTDGPGEGLHMLPQPSKSDH